MGPCHPEVSRGRQVVVVSRRLNRCGRQVVVGSRRLDGEAGERVVVSAAGGGVGGDDNTGGGEMETQW